MGKIDIIKTKLTPKKVTFSKFKIYSNKKRYVNNNNILAAILKIFLDVL